MEKQGFLRLKKDGGGYRHYIELPDGSHDNIHCGYELEVQLGKYWQLNDPEEHFEDFVPGPWIVGRYEASLCNEPIRARLVIGAFYPYGCGEAAIPLSLGVTVRRPKK